MARGKYGAGRATGGDGYDLIDIGYVPTGDTGSSISGFVGPDVDKGSGDEGGTAGTSSSSTATTAYGSSVPQWRRTLAGAIAPRTQQPRTSRAPISRTTGLGSRAGSPPSRTRPARPTAQIVYGLDNRERIISAILAVLAIAFAIVVGVIGSHVAKTTKGVKPLNSLVLMGVFGLPALAMLLGVAIKRRALVGFTALLTGFALFTFGVFYAVVYFALGGWLVFPAYKYNKQVALEKESSGPRPGRASGAASKPAATSFLRHARRRGRRRDAAAPLVEWPREGSSSRSPRRTPGPANSQGSRHRVKGPQGGHFEALHAAAARNVPAQGNDNPLTDAPAVLEKSP